MRDQYKGRWRQTRRERKAQELFDAHNTQTIYVDEVAD